MSDKMTAAQSMVAVMERVRGLAKSDRNNHFNFNFRGIDAVMNAVGPALREVGAVIVPEVKTIDRNYGGKMTGTVVHVAYHWHGPDGSVITGSAAGEAFDTGDKSVPKAMSVAYRTYLLQALCLPTDEPDPDSHSYTEPVRADADRARQELRDVLAKNNLPPQWAGEQFRERTGTDLNTTTDATAIRDLIQKIKEKTHAAA